MSILEAVLADADPAELKGEDLPVRYTAAHLHREDLDIFEDVEHRDVTRSIRVGDVPLPELAPDEVLIAVMASAINYNTIWSAMFRPIPTFRFLEELGRQGGWDSRHDQPYHVIGSDAAGVVVKTGAAVRSRAVGDRVVATPLWLDDQDPVSQADAMLATSQRAWGFETNFGGLAHFTVVKASQCVEKPRHLSWEEAACNTLCLATSYRMLVSPWALQMKQGDVVLVWGAAGGLGAYAVQLVRSGGGIAIGVVGSARKAAALERLGCDVIVRRDEIEADLPSEAEAARRIGKVIRREVGEDPHIVVDYTGRDTFGKSVFLCRRGGAVVTCGSSTGYSHTYDNRYLWMRLKRIIGSHGANWQECVEANRLLSLGRVVPTLSRVYPLAEVAEAARHVQSNEHIGKVGVLCLAPREGMGIEDHELRERIGEERLRVFRE
ncbi:MAG: crotonyl-CoA carboxylase/reductase [Solirubrobacterales bacterium]